VTPPKNFRSSSVSADFLSLSWVRAMVSPIWAMYSFQVRPLANRAASRGILS
jgi:hypothetical protein